MPWQEDADWWLFVDFAVFGAFSPFWCNLKWHWICFAWPLVSVFAWSRSVEPNPKNCCFQARLITSSKRLSRFDTEVIASEELKKLLLTLPKAYRKNFQLFDDRKPKCFFPKTHQRLESNCIRLCCWMNAKKQERTGCKKGIAPLSFPNQNLFGKWFDRAKSILQGRFLRHSDFFRPVQDSDITSV